jgi:outer membrane protein OmpA-like peptidoglycan-associated protein
MKIIRPSLIALLLMSSQVWAQDVKLYDKAPSVEELQRQLGTDDAGGKKKVRTRAIVFGDAPPPAAEQQAPQAQQQQAQPMPQQQAVAVQQPVAAAPAAQQTMQVGERAIAFPINFRVNSSDVMPESVPFIESIAGLLQKDPSIRLLIEGHTDASGSMSRNMSLSRERAFSVMNYLIDRYRVDPMRLVPVGKGPNEPLGGLEPTNPKNRRVQFRIIG